MKLISVVIPSYNHAAYIEQAVKSVLGQTYGNFELIVVDDGSRDSSLEYLRSISDPRYRLIEQENQGAHSAINRGLSMTQGEYITILNSDDVFHLDRLRSMLRYMEQRNLGLAATWIEVINHKGHPLGIKEGWKNMLPWEIRYPEQTFIATDDFGLNLLMTNFVATTSNVFFTREVYEKTGGMRNLRFAHDWDFLLRVAREFPCELVPEPLLQYRVHQTNTISSNRAWMLFEICWVLAANLPQFEGKLIYRSNDAVRIAQELAMLNASINLQGNDRLFWLIRELIHSGQVREVKNPEERLLDDGPLREALISLVKT